MPLFTELMEGLSTHLRPAPYPYGLLTLRLLGKLGGKNRRFLRDPIDVHAEDKINSMPYSPLAIDCKWLGGGEHRTKMDSTKEDDKAVASPFALPLPLENCVERLQIFASIEGVKKRNGKRKHTDSESTREWKNSWEDSARLWELCVEEIDFSSYCSNVMEQTKREQAVSAFRVICAALTKVLQIGDISKCTLEVMEGTEFETKEAGANPETEDIPGEPLNYDNQHALSRDKNFANLCLGVMYGCVIVDTKNEAELILKGFTSHIYFVVLSHHQSFKRIDANGSRIRDLCIGNGTPRNERQNTAEKSEGNTGSDARPQEHERLGSLKPFGYFHRVGILGEGVDPLLFNQAVAAFLAATPPHATPVGLQVVRQLLSHAIGVDVVAGTSKRPPVDSKQLSRGTLLLFENLISHLCKACFSHEWNHRDGVQEAICVIIENLGCEWALKYEEELVNVAFFAVKSVPRELSTAVVKALRFFVRLSFGLYGRPRTMDAGDGLIWDSLAVTDTKKPEKEPKTPIPESERRATRIPCTGVLQVVLSELASCKQIVR